MAKTHSETERLEALKALEILDSQPEPVFDNITELAKEVFNMPIALISLVDENRQWFKSKRGIETCETPRDFSFCQHTILQDGVYEIKDASKHALFKNTPLVTGEPYIRYYAGVPIESLSGQKIGTLCVIDRRPRRLQKQQLEILKKLAQQVTALISAHAQQRKVADLNAALNEKVYLLRKVTDNFPGLIVYWDQHQTCRYANQAYLTLLEQNLEGVVGQTYDALITPTNAIDKFKPYFLRGFAGETFEVEFNCDTDDASKKIHLARYLPDFDDAGNVIGLLVIYTDITSLRKTEEDEILHSRILQHSSDCIIITDEHFKIEFVNPSFINLTHHQAEDVIGLEPAFLFTQSDQPNTYLEIKQMAKEAQTWRGDLWLAKKTGGLFYTLLSVDQITDAHNQVKHYTFSLRDQTENENMRSELFIMTDMLNRTGKMAKVGGWELELATEKVLWTDEVFNIHELPNTTEPSLHDATMFYPQEARQVLEQALNTATSRGKPWDLELPFVTAKNNHLWVRSTGECIRFNNKSYKLTGTFQDITERKLAELQKQQDEIKHSNTLVREVHHRIKNNLQGVSGILSNFAASNPEQAPLFNEANAQLQSVAVIYGLQGQRPDASIELGELVFAISMNIQRLWQTDIQFNLSDDWVKAYLDKNESVPIALIMNELITNAVKHQVVDNSASVTLTYKKTTERDSSTIKNKVLISVSNLGDYMSSGDEGVDTAIKEQSGLTLMSALMPKRGAYIHWDIKEPAINVSLELSYPVITFEQQREKNNERETTH